MRVALCLAVVILGATATPNGYYHQQYNYKTSASSYKNNELQHKTDDQGYYSKDGDLEGRVKPKVSSNSEHSEYVNPQLRERGNTGYIDAETDLTSHGNLLANNYGGYESSLQGGVSSGYRAGSQYGSDAYSEGLASSDHIGGATNLYGVYGSGSQSSSSYGSSSLRTVASRLQNDLQQEMQEALRSQSRYSQQDLEAELHRNLTARVNQLLQEQYGTQTVRGGQSYSLTDGRLQARPNYEQQDLENIQRQVENSLLQKLRYEYTQGSRQSGSQQIYNQNYGYYETTTTYRPTSYRPIYPNLNVITTPRPYPEYPGGTKDSYYSQNEYNANRVSSNVRYTPVPNPLSITTIASNVQSQLDSKLNRLLEQAQTQYFSETSGYSIQNLDSVLDRLRQELKSNLTYILDEQLRSQYGTQVQKNNYMYTVGSGGETSSQYNYNAADLENLRRQVESNLLTKLNRDFESARERWTARQQLQRNEYEHSQSNNYRYGSSNNQRLEYSTPRYGEDNYYRPTSASIVPLISTGIKGNQYQAVSGSHQSSYGSSGSSSNFVDLQRQLQTDLSRQLQAAISQNQAHASRYSTQGTYDGGSFEEAYQRLYNDLQRNLTQQIQEFEAGSSGYSQSYGSVSDAQLASLKSQLQRQLASQLQSGLQQSYSASASYSASSGSSASAGAGAGGYSSSGGAYRGARGSQGDSGYSGYGQYRSGGYLVEGEDCQGDDPNAYHSHRAKRSYGYRSRPVGLPTSGSGYSDSNYGGYNSGYNGNFGGSGSGGRTWYGQQPQPIAQQPQPIGQEIDDSDLTQQVEPIDEFTGQQQIDVGQQVDDSDDTQQVEIDTGFGQIELGSQNNLQSSGQQRLQLGRENFKPQVEGNIVEQPQNNSQARLNSPRPSSQHTNIGGYGNPDIGSQTNIGQQVDDSNLGQQVDDSDFGLPAESVGFGYPKQNLTYTRKPNDIIELGQEIDDSDLTQQTEDVNFGHFYPQPNRKPLASDSNVGTMQVGSNHFSNIGNNAFPIQSTTKRSIIREPESHYTGQEIDDTDTIQHVNPSSDFGVPGVGSLVRTPTKKPQSTSEFSFNYQSPDYDNKQTGLTHKPVSGEANRNTFQHENNFQNSRGLSDDRDLTQLEEHPFNNLGTPVYNNNREEAQPEPNSNLNKITTTYSLSTLNLPTKVKEVFQQTETNLITQLKSTIKNEISYSIAPSELYQNILRKWQNNIHSECQKLLQDHSYYFKIDQSYVNQFEQYLTTSFETKIQEELQNYGFSRENLGITSFDSVVQTNNQNSNFGSSLHYGRDQRYQYTGRYSPKPVSSNDFINREINSQSGVTVNSEGQFINQQSNPVPTLDQVIDNNRQLYGNNQGNENNRHVYDGSQVNDNTKQLYGGQVSTHYLSSAQNSNRQPGRNTAFYPGNALDAGKPDVSSLNPLPSEVQQNPTGDSTLYLNTPQPQHPTTNLEYVTPKSQVKWEIGEPGYVPFINTPKPVVNNVNLDLNKNPRPSNNIQSIEIGPGVSRPVLPADNQVVDYERDVQTKPNEGNIQLSRNPSSDNLNPLDLSNFPPLPPPKSTPSVMPAIPRQPSSSQTPTQWQTNINEGQRNQQSIADAEREADLLIQQLRDAQQNRQTQNSNQHQEGGIESYGSQYDSSRYNHRTVQSSPNQYNVVQVKLENVTPEQFSIIKQIDDDFTRIIEEAVKNQVETTLTYQQSLKKLESDLKVNLTQCIEGNVDANLGSTNLDLQKYSDLIYQKFEQKKIQNLNKYLEIKLIKKIREKLRTAYTVDNEESTYELHQHNTNVEPATTHYQTPEYEVIQVKLENITPSQLRIINQMEYDFNKQIEAAIQTELTDINSGYLYSYESYQKSFNELAKDLKNNVTECVQGVAEPGLSKYADLIGNNFDDSKIAKLQKYLEIKLTKTLRESLKTHFKFYGTGSGSFGSNLNTGSLNYNYGSTAYQSSHHYGVQYGHTHNVHSQTASEIEPVEYQHATIVNHGAPSYSGGVKGKKFSQVREESPVIPTSYANSRQPSQPNIENVPEETEPTITPDETIETVTEKAGWWQRVKQGASNIKKKIVGSS